MNSWRHIRPFNHKITFLTPKKLGYFCCDPLPPENTKYENYNLFKTFKVNDLTSFEPPVISTGKKRGRNDMEKLAPLKFRKIGSNWDLYKRTETIEVSNSLPTSPSRRSMRTLEVEITPPPPTPLPPRRSKRVRGRRQKKNFID